MDPICMLSEGIQRCQITRENVYHMVSIQLCKTVAQLGMYSRVDVAMVLRIGNNVK